MPTEHKTTVNALMNLDQKIDIEQNQSFNRIEVISEEREFVRYLKDDEVGRFSIQDDGKTIKFFIAKK